MSRVKEYSEFEDTLYDDINEDTQKDKFLIFQIGSEDYGIEIKHVVEIITMQTITEVPEMPNYIKGIINLKGKVIPLMDVSIRFNLDPIKYNERTCIVIVEVNQILVGLIVERVSEVTKIPAFQIEGAPNTGSIIGKGFIQGIGKSEDKIKILLNIEKFLYHKPLFNLRKQPV